MDVYISLIIAEDWTAIFYVLAFLLCKLINYGNVVALKFIRLCPMWNCLKALSHYSVWEKRMRCVHELIKYVLYAQKCSELYYTEPTCMRSLRVALDQVTWFIGKSSVILII